jgi:DNA-binding NarL/FixJ family response regulator
VEVAEDGADALEQLATGRFDLVFTDRLMPVLDWERLVLALRSAGIRIPVVMIHRRNWSCSSDRLSPTAPGALLESVSNMACACHTILSPQITFIGS